MAEYIKEKFNRRQVVEEERLNRIHEESEDTLGPVGSAFFEYAYGEDIDNNRHSLTKEKWDYSGKRMEFARVIVKTLETGTTEEKVEALTAVLRSFEVHTEIEIRERPPIAP